MQRAKIEAIEWQTSFDTMGYSFKHLPAFFGQKAKAADGAPGAALRRLSPPFGLASVTC